MKKSPMALFRRRDRKEGRRSGEKLAIVYVLSQPKFGGWMMIAVSVMNNCHVYLIMPIQTIAELALRTLGPAKHWGGS
jgi:hypothetical protein